MKKCSRFKKGEKAILATGILMITVVLTVGLLKQKFVKAEAYVPLKEEQQSINAIAAKKKTFIVEQNAKLSQKAEAHVNADSDVLKKVKLGLPTADVTIPGTYQAVVSLQRGYVSLAIKVVENARPVMRAAHADFQLVVESSSMIQEVCDYVGVTAADAPGNDLSASITGWDEELSVEVRIVTYQSNVGDAQGQRAKKLVRVQHLLPKEDKEGQY